MGKAEKKEHLNMVLSQHLNTIHETFQVLDQTPSSSLEKVSWNQVIQLGEQVSKQATMVGMLWTGEIPEVKVLEENMAAYFNLLQGFLLLSHGSTVGAGATLLSSIHASVKQVVDCSFMLLKEAVSSYGSSNKTPKLTLPQLAGTVWEACSALKKTPNTNVTAIGRAMTKVAVSIKDVLREMKELKPASSDPLDEPSDPLDEPSDEVPTNPENEPLDSDNDSSDEDLGNDLSPEEMKIAALTTAVVSETVVVIKELIRSISGLIKIEDLEKHSNCVDSLERLLKMCQEIGVQVDELGASLYPPQEVEVIRGSSEKVASIVGDMQVELETLKGLSEAFINACAGLRSSVKDLELEVVHAASDLVPEMEKLDVSR